MSINFQNNVNYLKAMYHVAILLVIENVHCYNQSVKSICLRSGSKTKWDTDVFFVA